MSGDRHAVQVGLIGDNIALSRSPRLHEVAGPLIGLEVRYDRLVPRDLGQSFEAVFEMARASGYRGLNITYPYKERVVPLVVIPDPRVAGLGAVNTVVFGRTGPQDTTPTGRASSLPIVGGAGPALPEPSRSSGRAASARRSPSACSNSAPVNCASSSAISPRPRHWPSS